MKKLLLFSLLVGLTTSCFGQRGRVARTTITPPAPTTIAPPPTTTIAPPAPTAKPINIAIKDTTGISGGWRITMQAPAGTYVRLTDGRDCIREQLTAAPFAIQGKLGGYEWFKIIARTNDLVTPAVGAPGDEIYVAPKQGNATWGAKRGVIINKDTIFEIRKLSPSAFIIQKEGEASPTTTVPTTRSR